MVFIYLMFFRCLIFGEVCSIIINMVSNNIEMLENKFVVIIIFSWRCVKFWFV